MFISDTTDADTIFDARIINTVQTTFRDKKSAWKSKDNPIYLFKRKLL